MRPRLPALLGVVPSVLLFFVWVVGRLGEPAAIEAGAPWKAWGPMLSPENLSFKPFEQNLSDLTYVLANQFHDGSDRWPVLAVAMIAAVGLLLSLKGWNSPAGAIGWIEAARMPGLAGLALLLFFTLPFDIRGFSYYLNTRYAHLAAPLILASVPIAKAAWTRTSMLMAAAGAALLLGVVQGQGFRRFSQEASALESLIAQSAEKPRVMGLIFHVGSRIVRHPVYLHSAAELARARGGLTNFSFALTPHSPLRYRSTPPPTFASEWRPDTFRYEQHGASYDHFLVRGVDPRQIFGPRLESELAVVMRSGDFFLVRRRN